MPASNSSIGAVNDYQLAVDFRSIRLTDEQFYRLCQDNPELRMELTSDGGLVVLSPTGTKTGWRNRQAESASCELGGCGWPRRRLQFERRFHPSEWRQAIA